MPRNIESTIGQIKAIEPGTYLNYTFPDIPQGVFFINQTDLIALVEQYEVYEKAFTALSKMDLSDERVKAIVDEALIDIVKEDEFDEDIEFPEDKFDESLPS